MPPVTSKPHIIFTKDMIRLSVLTVPDMRSSYAQFSNGSGFWMISVNRSSTILRQKQSSQINSNSSKIHFAFLSITATDTGSRILMAVFSYLVRTSYCSLSSAISSTFFNNNIDRLIISQRSIIINSIQSSQ